MRGFVLGLLIAASGCATIMAGGPDQIPVNSNPPGAAVFVDGILVGQTPMVITLDRAHSEGRIQIQAPGFAPVLIQRDKVINGWFWANLCFAVWPMIVDLVTGDYNRFDDDPIAIGLTPAGGPGYPQQGYPQPGPPQTSPQQGAP